MTKDESLQLKGIAILMMLWLHLFGTDRAILENSENFIHLWNGAPIAYAMRKLGRMCVVLYTFLGGYGLAKVYQRSGSCTRGFGIYGGMNNGKRVWKLFTNYWIVLLMFMAVAVAIKPDRYPGDISEITGNITALNCTYNDSLWFLLPYAMLTLVASPIIKFANSLHGTRLWITLAVAFTVKCAVYNIARPTGGLGSLMLKNIIEASGLFFMFFVGILFARDSFMERTVTSIKQWFSRSFAARSLHISTSAMCTVILAALFFGRIVLGASTLIDPIYILLIVLTFLCIETPKWLSRTLAYLGSHSTNIWFTHRYILVLSGTLITLFRYPVVIISVLVLCCLTCSYIINAVKRLFRI
jgi:hypothetical protein